MERLPFRIGHGYDVHRLVENRKLILGGVEIPYEKGLLGHSDADVLLHAVSDALLGALALGDIGKHFPDTDPAYAGADSLKLLELVVEKVREQGYAVGNLDATVLCQKPKLAPYIAFQQSGQSLVMFFQVASVFEEVFMFFFANVHTYATEFASFNCVSQSFGVNQTATSNVDEDNAVFHLSDSILVDHVSCCGHQRAVDGDNISTSIQFIQSYIFQTQIGVRECIISDDVHAEAFQNVNHALTDFTCTDDTCCFAVQSDTCQTSDIEVEFCCSFIGQMRLSVNSHQKRCALFCYGLRRVSGYSQYGQTTFFCNIHQLLMFWCNITYAEHS